MHAIIYQSSYQKDSVKISVWCSCLWLLIKKKKKRALGAPLGLIVSGSHRAKDLGIKTEQSPVCNDFKGTLENIRNGEGSVSLFGTSLPLPCKLLYWPPSAQFLAVDPHFDMVYLTSCSQTPWEGQQYLSIPFYNGRNWAHSADIIDHVPRAVKIHWWTDTVPTFGEAGREQWSQTGSDDMALDYEGSK